MKSILALAVVLLVTVGSSNLYAQKNRVNIDLESEGIVGEENIMQLRDSRRKAGKHVGVSLRKKHGKFSMRKKHTIGEVKFAMQIIKKHDPLFAEELKKKLKENPKLYTRAIARLRPTSRLASVERGDAVAKKSIKILKLEINAIELINAYANNNKADKVKIKKQLEKNVSQQFDLKLERKQATVKRIGEKLQRLKTKIKERKENKSKLVNERVKELLGEKLTW